MSQGTVAAISTLVVDDEQLARDELTFLLKEHPEVDVIDTAHNGLAAVQLIEQLEPDLVFLDVEMPGLDGMGVIHQLRSKNFPLPDFVLTTAYDQYAIEAFRLQAFDYLLKPVDKDRLAETIRHLQRSAGDRSARPETLQDTRERPALQRSKLLVRSNARNWLVDVNDMVYATIDDGLITVVTTQLEGHSNYRTIEELQSNLDAGIFWRVHRSFLVNINRIREVIPWAKSSFQLKMDDRRGSEIPVSRIQTKRLRELLKL